MNNLKNILERANIYQVQSFLLYGEEDLETEFRSYEQRLEEGLKPVHDRLKKLLPDEKVQDDILWDIYKALSAYEQVYMEIGMKAGAKLAFQLLHEKV